MEEALLVVVVFTTTFALFAINRSVTHSRNSFQAAVVQRNL